MREHQTRAGLGGSVEPAWHRGSIEHLRWEFWKAGAEQYPDAFLELRRLGVGRLRRIREDTPADGELLDELFPGMPSSKPPISQWAHLSSESVHDGVKALRALVRDWCRRYRVAVDWAEDLALKTLAYWVAHPKLARRLVLPSAGWSGPLGPEPESFDLNEDGESCPGFEPTRQGREDWKRRVLDDPRAASGPRMRFRWRVIDHIKEQDAQTRAAGSTVSVVRYSERHVQWLARSRFGRQSAKSIAQKEPDGIAAVEKATKRLGHKIGLPELG